jgi:hypothetical protein
MFLASLVVVLLVIGRGGPWITGKAAAPAATISHLGVSTDDMFASGLVAVDPGEAVSVFTIPEGKTFILTDVLVYPDNPLSNREFFTDYELRENDLLKFKYRIVAGSEADWNQHFTGGIKFSSGSAVRVEVNSFFTSSRMFFQLLGYFTTP